LLRVNEIRQHFIDELKAERFTTDRLGDKTIELIGASFLADEPAIFGEPNEEYIEAELGWYYSQSTNIDDIYANLKEPPKAWQYAANAHGEINSNYGHLILSDKYYNQYERALAELMANRDSRRACIVYNRPSIWTEYNENGKSDFICTNAVTYYVRGDQLHCCVQMRSNDVIFGYRNDYAWQKHVLDKMVDDLNHKNFDHVEPGDIYWQVQNLHVYEKHFHLVRREDW
jgi:thymidylate synthase